MGARNVAGVFVKWGHLPPTSKLLLIYMAHVAHDGPEPTFWGGREALAGALGRAVPGEPERGDESPEAADARATRNAAFVAVRAATTSLVKAGAISFAQIGANGRRTEYRLHLDPFTKVQGEPAPMAQGEPAPMAQGEPAPMAQGEPAPMAQGEPAPEEQQRNNRGLPRGRTSPDPTTHLAERPAGVEAMSEGGGRALAAMRAAGVIGQLPTWCGHCTEASRMLTPTGAGPHRPRRCPDCHPLAVAR